jgi:hypothetical protein
MYQTKTDRKMQTQQRIIEHLQEENEYLKEQLKLCDSQNVQNKIMMAKNSYAEYQKLIDELQNLKKEYQTLIMEIKKEAANGKNRIRRK